MLGSVFGMQAMQAGWKHETLICQLVVCRLVCKSMLLKRLEMQQHGVRGDMSALRMSWLCGADDACVYPQL